MERFLLPPVSAQDAATTATPFDEGLVLDLGCGSGRDAVYMAQHLPPGTPVVGVDNHSYALERGARLAEQWLEGGCGGGGGGESDHGAVRRPSADAASGLEAGEKAVRPGAGRRSAPGGPKARRRRCEWLLADLRKEGSLDGMRASVVHGHRFKCERLLPLLRDDVSELGATQHRRPRFSPLWFCFLDTSARRHVLRTSQDLYRTYMLLL